MATIDQPSAQPRSLGKAGRARSGPDDAFGAAAAFDIGFARGRMIASHDLADFGSAALVSRGWLRDADIPAPPQARADGLTPADPLFASQWHFGKIGDIQTIWDEFTGAGVHVGIYDTGIEVSHPDLAANHDASRLFTNNGTTWGDGIPTVATYDPQFHGTSVAGLIAAPDNGIGIVGVAFGSTFTGINIFDGNSALDINGNNGRGSDGFFASLRSLAFDVVNNSWGNSFSYNAPGNLAFPEPDPLGFKATAAWGYVAANGRDGLGTICVSSAGNSACNANAFGDKLDRFSIKVAAVGSADTIASYSNHGANILVAAPGGESATNGGLGIVTTDRTGTAGSNQRGDTTGAYDYTNDFVGTSAAAPIVSGVATLMLDANPNLGWRDVQNILALSATHIGSAYSATTAGTYENGYWKFNSADDWNGGGLHTHINYGYGMVDAYAAVRMAEAWSLFAPAQTSANEQSVVVTTTPMLAIIDNPTGATTAAKTTTTFTVTGDLKTENLNLTIDYKHTGFWQLYFRLIAPDGNVYVLEDTTGTINQGFSGYDGQWTFTIAGLHEQSPLGTWTLEILDTRPSSSSGTLRGITASFTGSAASADNVYHYTDEFQTVAAIDPSRSTLHDTDGGTDWLDLSAVTGAVTLDLNPGASSTLAGQAFITVAADAAIENAVTGDGNDTVTGNALANVLYGMRGNDALYGRDGADILTGGRGDDTIDGGAGYDIANYADTAAGVAVTIGSSDAAQNTGAAGIDVLRNIEKLIGSAFDDVLTAATVAAPAPLFVDNAVDHGSTGSAVPTDASFVANGGAAPHVIVTVTGSSQKYFRFTVSEAGTSRFTVGNATFDSQIQLYNANGAFIGGSGFSANHYSFERSLTPGTYYVAFGDGSAANNATYTFDISVPGHPLALTAASLDGGAGDDLLAGGIGLDTIDGGTGLDTVSYAAATSRVAVNLGTTAQQNTVGSGLDTLLNIEHVIATRYNDEIIGNGVANALTGGDGRDTLFGAGGDDRLFGGNGDDTLTGRTDDDMIDGGAGFDTASYTASRSAVTVDLALTGAQLTGSEGTDTLVSIEAVRGGALGDTLFGNAEANTLYGNAGNDRLDGRGGVDKMYGGAGDDVIVIETAGDLALEDANDGTDTVEAYLSYTLRANVENLMLLGGAVNGSGNALANMIAGNGLGNALRGLAGNDILFGGDGADRLDGGDDRDVLFGDAGRDTLTGGAGADDFTFDDGDSAAKASLADVIADFSASDGDRIDLHAIDAIAATSANDAFTWIDSAAFTRHAGELRYVEQNGVTYLQGDTNGDGRADLVIRLDGLHALTPGDLVF